MYVLLEALWLLCYILYSYVQALLRIIVPKGQKSVKDKIVLITGGANGIGREVALRMAEKGAIVVIIDVDVDGSKQTADDIQGQGAQVHTYICDIGRRDQVAKTAALVRQDVGNVDLLFNNAGISDIKRLKNLSDEDVRRTLDANLISHFWMLQEFLPSMITRNSGHVITTCSYAGIAGSEYMADYVASKFAVRGLTEAVEREMLNEGATNIKFTTIYPSFTNTNLLKKLEDRAQIHDKYGKVMEPSYVGEAIVDGVLRDKRHIYIPSWGFIIDMLKCLIPKEGIKAIYTFLDMRMSIKE